MKCIIVDDDKLSCKILEGYVNKFSTLDLAGIFNDPISARNAIAKDKDIELVFLDIKMPEMDGFDFIGSLDTPPNIIIVSGNEEFALRAFDFNVVDFLLKPITYSGFAKAVDKTIRYFSHMGDSQQATTRFSSRRDLHWLNSSLRILFVEALENYVTLHTKTTNIPFTLQ